MFETWLTELKKLAKNDFNFSEEDLLLIDFESEYWEEKFNRKLSQKEALTEDQGQE